MLTVETKQFDHHDKHSEVFIKKAKNVSKKLSVLKQRLQAIFEEHSGNSISLKSCSLILVFRTSSSDKIQAS